MTNFVPHDQYRTFINQQCRRVKQAAVQAPLWAGISLGVAGTLVAMPLVFGDLGLVVTIVLGPISYFVWTSGFRKMVFFDRNITCPHCEARLDLSKNSLCGACGLQNETDRFFGTAIQPCPHCASEPHSLMCPNCGNDIVFDIYAYNKAEKVGYGFAGTRKLI